MTLNNVESGVDLQAALAERPHAWITAVGEVADVELSAPGAEGVTDSKLRGVWTLASLMGPGAGPYWVVLSRSSDTGIQVAAGQLKRATSRGVHVFGSEADAAVPVESAAAPARAQPTSPRTAAPDAPAEPAWAAQAQAATPPRAAADDDDDDRWPDAGDLVEHFAFGLCDVLMASDDRLKIRDKNGPGRIREIRAEVLRVHPPVAKDGKRLFKLERKN